jgi:glycosyltransferase involved in cell wall biosynthesis
LWEGTPLTVFEALAAGKPIVATDADGLLDVLTDGVDARIVPKRDSPALADAIVDLIDHPQERVRLAAAARLTAQRFDIAAFVRKMERLYLLLHEQSRATHRRAILENDLSFLTGASPTEQTSTEDRRRPTLVSD